MLFYVVFGMLAAFGAFCALYITVGALLNKGNVTALCTEESESRGRWLRSLGFVNDVEVRKNRDGTGTGDHPGRDQRRGVSKL